MKVKQKIPEEKKEVVYQVPCKDCCKVETKRTLKTRISEHKQAVKKGDEKNGIAVHAHTTNHNIDWEDLFTACLFVCMYMYWIYLEK